MTDDENFGLKPSYIYRISDPETRRIIGLKTTQIHDAIARGELPRPVMLTENGRARGYLGVQLISLQRKRLAAANNE